MKLTIAALSVCISTTLLTLPTIARAGQSPVATHARAAGAASPAHRLASSTRRSPKPRHWSMKRVLKTAAMGGLVFLSASGKAFVPSTAPRVRVDTAQRTRVRTSTAAAEGSEAGAVAKAPENRAKMTAIQIDQPVLDAVQRHPNTPPRFLVGDRQQNTRTPVGWLPARVQQWAWLEPRPMKNPQKIIQRQQRRENMVVAQERKPLKTPAGEFTQVNEQVTVVGNLISNAHFQKREKLDAAVELVSHLHPNTDQAVPEKMMENAIAGAVSGLDPYTRYQRPEELQQWSDGLKLARAGVGISFAERPAGVYVDRVAKNGPGRQAGLKAGDRVVAINGMPVNTASQVSGLLDGRARGSALTLVVEHRNHNVRELTVKPGREGIGINYGQRPTEFVVERVLNGPAKKAGVRAGDRLVAVNGAPIRSMAQARDLLSGKPGSALTVQVERTNHRREALTFKRGPVKFNEVGVRVTGDGIAVVRLEEFDQGMTRDFMAKLDRATARGEKPLKGLILDLRGNPGGLVDEAITMLTALGVGGKTIHTRDRAGDVNSAYELLGPMSSKGIVPANRIRVLIDGGSASASEIVAGTLRDHGATLIGDPTYGKGIGQGTFMLPPGDSAVTTTSFRYYLPNGSSPHRFA